MKSKRKKQPLISVIIPVYNVREYLDECVQSVINQDIGFGENIELILVNDGSTDGSDEICEKYASRYINIKVIHKENGGVSSARNAGFREATSDFIAFLDSDDKVARNFYRLLYKEIVDNKKVPLVVGRTKNFDSDNGYHATDEKFSSTRLIDLSVTPYFIQTLPSPILFRKTAINDISFNENMTHSEDSEFINRVFIANESKYIVVKEAVYFYRKRSDKSSATGVSKYRKTYYMSAIELVDKLVGSEDGKQKKSIPKFIQYALLYQIGWRMRVKKMPEVLNANEWVQYKKALKRAIQVIDDDVVVHGGASVGNKERRAIFAIKYDYRIRKVSQKLKLSEADRLKLYKEFMVCIDRMYYEKNKIHIYGSTLAYDIDNVGLKLNIKYNSSPVSFVRREHTELFMDDKVTIMSGIDFSIPASNLGVLTVDAVDKNSDFRVPISHGTSAGARRGTVTHMHLAPGILVALNGDKIIVLRGLSAKYFSTVFRLYAKKIILKGESAAKRAGLRASSFVKR